MQAGLFEGEPYLYGSLRISAFSALNGNSNAETAEKFTALEVGALVSIKPRGIPDCP
jgi:hypothetical protein